MRQRDLASLIGKRFHRLLVTSRAESGVNTRPMWMCVCDCGTVRRVLAEHLKNGNTKSCGCYNRERKRPILKHGHARWKNHSSTYNIWASMLARCNNPNCQAYKWYGVRGIKVCERWLKFENFLADMGERPEKLSLDRIDNDGNYEPGNCRWVAHKEQSTNRAKTKMLTRDGKTMCMRDWALELNIPNTTFSRRVKDGTWASL